MAKTVVRQDSVSTDQLTEVLRATMVALVKRDGRDLRARQLAIFLTCYLRDEPQTVRGLAAQLNIARPTVTCALDRLAALGFAQRTVEPGDRRSIIVERTSAGKSFLRQLTKAMTNAAAAVEESRDGTRVVPTA
jgi:DNA-binding MarR family transcriptional regulator